jgi:hypothetical protein|tara:strand:- start:2925 stop:3143 length:219 start_codon:yes stop_codon:yes gene_type:complete
MSELVSIFKNIFKNNTPENNTIKNNIQDILSKQSQLSKRENNNKMYKMEFIMYSIAVVILLLSLIYLMFINK